jgi:hypothetical protein
VRPVHFGARPRRELPRVPLTKVKRRQNIFGRNTAKVYAIVGGLYHPHLDPTPGL